MSKRFNKTLYFKTLKSVKSSGYQESDVVLVDDDDAGQGYMTVVTFFCDSYEVEEDSDLLTADDVLDILEAL